MSARIGVPDLDASVAFYQTYVGLELVKNEGDRAFLRAGLPHHALELVHRPGIPKAEVAAITFATGKRDVLENRRESVAKLGYDVRPLSEGTAAYCADGFAVTGPNGLEWEFVHGYYEYVEPPFLVSTPDRIMHPFVRTDDYGATLQLATDGFGLQISDYVEDAMTFLRCEDRYHHSLALLKGSEFRIQHFSFIVADFDHLMRARARAQSHGITIKTDLVKHSGSTTIAFYLLEEAHGPEIELSYGHRRFSEEDHETAEPRRLASGARTEFDLWRESDSDWRGLH
ncbi:VOC family protein [Cryptosporangium phraense]|uniref:VOC family protein n=1 Tax=Cryptosporangium phraense TaxID=2593070 RepID=UPI0014794AD0|nr:VOC family protein [Cryptosporangium phraense]